jgi:hypothetical protein
MDEKYGAVFCGDGCGVGKTHEIQGYIIAGTLFWDKRGSPMNKPTLLVCPNSLVKKTFQDVKDQLGADSYVYQYGQNVGARGEPLRFDPRHPVYRSQHAGRTVVFATFTQLQNCRET